MAPSIDSDQPGAPLPQDANQLTPNGPQSEEAARKLVREQLLVLAATIAAILAVVLVAHAMRSAGAPITQKQVESKLDYLVGSSAVAVYNALDGYPVVFMMPDDGDPLGTWAADEKSAGAASGATSGAATEDTSSNAAASNAAASDADSNTAASDADAQATGAGIAGGAAGSSPAENDAIQTGNAAPRTYVDVTYQVQVAAHNDYALDDERYQVTGYSPPDTMTGQITVYVTELFRMYEEELSQTLPIDAVADALQAYGDGAYPGGFELLLVKATSIEAESGTWLVRGTARAMESGAAGASATDASAEVAGAAGVASSEAAGADGDGWRSMEFTARVSGSADAPQVASFSPLA